LEKTRATFGKTEKKKRRGAEEGSCPTLPWTRRRPSWPAMLFAPYPATKPGSPRAYIAVLSTVAQHEMRCEMSILPLTTEPIFKTTTASLSSGLANTQRIHALALTDEWLP
jgi:hypothetical protein